MRVDIPVTPEADTAQEWLEEELSRPVYSQGDSILDRMITWLLNTLVDVGGDGAVAVPPLGWLIIVAAIAAGVGAAWLLAGPIRLRMQRRRAAGSTVMEFDARSLPELRRAAADAARAEDWSLALLERYRAIVKSLEQRSVLDEREGRTALEAARDAGRRLPTLATRLVATSAVFDSVCYGHDQATRADYDEATALAKDTDAAQPDFAEAGA